ncbi:MAG: hypothetical protein L3J65_00215 [Robiginitomaculum sp.]|nr:hypothetical protein [Robiginitomaculum sp.]
MSGANVFAASAQDIRVTLESGRYDLAAAQGSALGTADGLVLAAEALNAKLLLGQAERKTKTAKKAMKLAQAALVLEPKNAEAQLQYALAYGFYGRHVSSFTAWRKNLPKKILAEIDKAAIMAPQDGRVHALKGAWHLNLLYRAGGFDVEKRYGANAQLGETYFQSALAKYPDGDIIINASYLMLKFVLEPEIQAETTKQALQNTLLKLKPKNAVEQQVITQMQSVYAGFETGEALKLAEVFTNQ